MIWRRRGSSVPSKRRNTSAVISSSVVSPGFVASGFMTLAIFITPLEINSDSTITAPNVGIDRFRSAFISITRAVAADENRSAEPSGRRGRVLHRYRTIPLGNLDRLQHRDDLRPPRLKPRRKEQVRT